MEPLAIALARNATDHPDRPAIIDGPTVLTHADVYARVAAVLEALADLAGRRLFVSLVNGHTAVVAHYAATIAGATALLVDAHMPQSELGELAARFQPEALLSMASLRDGVAAVRARVPQLGRVLLLPDSDGATPAAAPEAGVTAVRWPSTGQPRAGLPADGDLDRISLVLSTTGTTGDRKLVSLTQRNVLAAARNINERMGVGVAAREVCPLPLLRSFGLGRARCLTLLGGTLVVAPPRGDRVLALLRQHGAHGLAGVPAFFRMLIQTFGPRLSRYLQTLEYIEIGSAPMEMADKLFLLEAAPRTRIYMHYGLTEASRSAFIDFRAERARLDTVGRPAPHVDLQVQGEDGRPCGPGQVGEIVVRGEHVCAGYWGDPVLTAERLRGGWLHTNDYGSVDADGYIHFAGRMDDMVNVGGVKVSPEKIETLARRMPGVLDCAVVGGCDPRGVYGEVPLLYVVPDARIPVSAQAVRSYCAEQLLPEEVPYEVRFIAAIPRTDTGKVQRARLRVGAP